MSPRSQTNKNKTNISSNRRASESIVDVNDIDLNVNNIADLGTIGADGGIELNQFDNQTTKNQKHISGKKSNMGAKSEMIYTDNILNGKQESTDRSNVSAQSAMVCRICLDYHNGINEFNDENFNPMISPCNCSGTMGGIHLKCLREWLERNKTMRAVKGHVVLKYKKVNCELCK